MESYEELMRRAKMEFPYLSHSLLEPVIKDYMAHPDYYDEIYNGNIEISEAKKRDTKDDDTNNIGYIYIENHECSVY